MLLLLLFSSPDYLQAIMARFCVVITLAVCCPMVTGVSLVQPVPASGRYTWLIACIPYVWQVYPVGGWYNRKVCIFSLWQVRRFAIATYPVGDRYSKFIPCRHTVYRRSTRYTFQMLKPADTSHQLGIPVRHTVYRQSTRCTYQMLEPADTSHQLGIPARHTVYRQSTRCTYQLSLIHI